MTSVTAEDRTALYQHPVELLQKLIRFDTTNPPGQESACISFVAGLLNEAGIPARVLAKVPARPNLVARLPGRGQAPPLLMYGHVDVVTTEHQPWEVPPFEGRIQDGFVWGRGALDMKGGVAMMLSAFLRAKADGLEPPGDVILALVCDEEALGAFGAKFLVEEHPDEFKGVRYAIGEFGGFTLYVGARRLYPIQVAEKQACSVRATVRGPGGHGSLPVRDGAMAKLGRLLQQLNGRRLPVRITPAARLMLGEMAAALGGVTGLMLRGLLNPGLTNGILNLLGERGRIFDPVLHNTVSPTILRGSEKFNVIPSEVAVELDGRLLPGCRPDDMIDELRQIAGGDVELEVVNYDPGPATEPDMGLFGVLAGVLREADPDGIPVPMLLTAVTDARLFSRLGIQTYGFLPMQLPADFSFQNTIHAANERIPVGAVEFGSDAIFNLLGRFAA